MNSKIVVVCFAVLLTICLSYVDANKEKGHKHKHTCLGTEIVFTDDQKKEMHECFKGKGETKEKKGSEESSGEWKKKQHNPCAMDCIFRKHNLITSDGKLDHEKLEAGIKKMYPEAAHAGLIKDTKECEKEVTDKITTDNDCKSFQKYQACYFKAVKENCHKDDKKA